MHFASMSEFFAMGGHGFYVWLAYGVAALVLLGFVVSIHIQKRQVFTQLRWAQRASEDKAEEKES